MSSYENSGDITISYCWVILRDFLRTGAKETASNNLKQRGRNPDGYIGKYDKDLEAKIALFAQNFDLLDACLGEESANVGNTLCGYV
jgi:hypothetical protein